MTPIPLRVTVLDTWDEIVLTMPSEATVADVKAQVLQAAYVVQPAEGYEIKFRGASVPEGATTLADAGIVPNAALIVLSRRRVPAK